MAGILGVAGDGDVDAAAFLDRASSTLAHRPWYVADRWSDGPSVGIGRSAIGILNREPQPALSADGRHVLVMSGEFYRTGQLRQRLTAAGAVVPAEAPDHELALGAFRALGHDCTLHLDGAFAIAIYDRVAGELTLINDRMGLYPTYYWTAGGRFVFAPEIRAVMCAPFVPRTLDLTAVAQYLRFQHLLGTTTFHDGIRLLPAATVGTFSLRSGNWSMRRYWDWDHIAQRPEMTFDEATEEASTLLRGAVQTMSRGALRPGVFLSGGLDSRALVGFLAETHPAPATATFGAAESRDVYYASRIARAVGSRHHWFDFPDGRWVLDNLDLHFALTEGFHSWVHMHGMGMLPALREVLDVNLTGWDGGTVMGHPDSANAILNRPPDHAALEAMVFDGLTRSYTWPGLTESEERLLYARPFAGLLIGRAFDSFVEEFRSYEAYRLDNRAEYFYVRNHCARLTQNMVTFMRSHIEVRSPFWDQPLVELMYGVRDDIRWNRRLYRTVLTRELPRLARIPYDKDERLPTTSALVRNTHAMVGKVRRTIGLGRRRATLYADYEAYLRGDLRSWAEGLVLDPSARSREFLDPAFVASLMARHASGHELWTIGKVASIVTLEMVLRAYFD